MGGIRRRCRPEQRSTRSISRTPKTSNIAVTGVDFRRDYAEDRERVAITARLVNRSAEAKTGHSVTLELNGRVLETKQVNLAANAAATVEFTAAPLPAGTTRGVVRSARRCVAARQLVLLRDLPRTGAVGSRDRSTAKAARRAVCTSSVRSASGSQPNFRVTTKRLGSVTAADFVGRSLILFNDSDLPGGELGRRLVEYVQNGGGLLVAMGDRAAPRDRPAYAEQLLPATADAPIDRSGDRGGTLGYIDRSHPIFELFSAPRSGDFSTPRFFRYRSVTPAPGDEQLARFDDGHIALLERKVGRGRVLVWTSSFDGIWNDLPLQPVFLPVAHQMAKYAAAYADERPWSVVGQVANLPAIFRDSTGSGDAANKADYVVVAPSGERTRLEGTAKRSVELGGAGLLRVAARGVARRAASGCGERRPRRVGPDGGRAAAAHGSDGRPRGGGLRVVGVEASTPVELERRQGFWWYLVGCGAAVAGGGDLALEPAVAAHRGSTLGRRATMASTIEITSAHETLLGVIRRVRARWRLKLALRGAAIVLGALVVAVLVGAYVMQTARFAPGAITGVRIAAYVMLAVLLVQYLVRPLLRRASDEHVALYLEEHEPSLDAAVLSAVEHGKLTAGHARSLAAARAAPRRERDRAEPCGLRWSARRSATNSARGDVRGAVRR